MKYYVTASYTYEGEIEVEASSKEEAMEKANSLTRGEIRDAIKANGCCVDLYVTEDEDDVYSEEDLKDDDERGVV